MLQPVHETPDSGGGVSNTAPVSPPERHLRADLQSARFLLGVRKGEWGDAEVDWPHLKLWVAADKRVGAPDRYWFRFDMNDYPTRAPTGVPWDPDQGQPLAHNRRPTGGSVVGKVFRIDWEGGRALYHPYDRVAAEGHKDWAQKYPGLVWTVEHTIMDLLLVIHRLLHDDDYKGARS